MDARVSRVRSGFTLRREPADEQARAERQALADILSKPNDRLLDDVGLTRRDALELLGNRTNVRRLLTAFFVRAGR